MQECEKVVALLDMVLLGKTISLRSYNDAVESGGAREDNESAEMLTRNVRDEKVNTKRLEWQRGLIQNVG